MTKKQIRKNGILSKGNVDTLGILVNKGLKQSCSISLIPARNKNSVVHRHGRIKYIVPGKSPQLVAGKDAVFLKREINRTVRILVGNASRNEVKIIVNFANERSDEIRTNSIIWVKETDVIAGGSLYPSNVSRQEASVILANNLDPGIPFRIFRSNAKAGIGRSIIYYNNFNVRISLRPNALERISQKTLLVVYGQNDTDFHYYRASPRILRAAVKEPKASGASGWGSCTSKTMSFETKRLLR